MKTLGQKEIKTAVRLTVALLFLVVVILLAVAFFPPGQDDVRRSTAMVERETWYEFCIDGEPVFFSNDHDNWATASLSANALDIPKNLSTQAATWSRTLLKPFCRGRLLTRGYDPSAWEKARNDSMDHYLEQRWPVLKKRREAVDKRIDELEYYLRTHNVTDEGYNTLANYHTLAQAERRTLAIIDSLLDKTASGAKLTIRYRQAYTLLGEKDNETVKTPCRILSTDGKEGVSIIQAEGRKTPDGARSLYTGARLGAEERRRLDDSMRTIIDTLNATISYKNAHYEGELGMALVPHGHGIMLSPNGKRYDGMWRQGRRNGFGISLDSDGRVRIGEWEDDVYKGEKPTYTADHIYGIDISRFQHEKGKRKLPVSWADVRITHLGSRSHKRISGEVDYPVSFCFIKATEGTTITNAYYNSDYRQARQHGIRVGTYHFLSMKSPARDQAEHFLKTAHLRPGDLPPMLDVEPSAAVIKQYGGTKALLDNIRTWMTIVEKRTGVRPILYSYQTFFGKYLAEADDIKRDYRVWIARYGEYKPDLRLIIWQLSSDGRVKGFTGDVDINVFNGYGDQWEVFLGTDSIK